MACQTKLVPYSSFFLPNPSHETCSRFDVPNHKSTWHCLSHIKIHTIQQKPLPPWVQQKVVPQLGVILWELGLGFMTSSPSSLLHLLLLPILLFLFLFRRKGVRVLVFDDGGDDGDEDDDGGVGVDGGDGGGVGG